MCNDLISRVSALKSQIHEHNYCYYVLAEPIIADVEFDLLLKELEDLERRHPELRSSDSPTQRVGAKKQARVFPLFSTNCQCSRYQTRFRMMS